jgi:hypothetical protein
VPGYPFVPLAFVVVMVWIVINAFLTRPAESAATLALILLGLPAYPLFRRSLAARADLTATPDPRP